MAIDTADGRKALITNIILATSQNAKSFAPPLLATLLSRSRMMAMVLTLFLTRQEAQRQPQVGAPSRQVP
jgi:hypothetical protein